MIPGGVNSPVRAFRSVGGTPYFVARAEGAYVWDAEGTQLPRPGPVVRRDHRRPRPPRDRRGHHARRRRRHVATARPTEREVAPRRGDPRPGPVVPEGPPGVERHRGDHDRACAWPGVPPGRDTVVKFAGNYHGHGDALLAESGPPWPIEAATPWRRARLGRRPDRRRRRHRGGARTTSCPSSTTRIACVIVEPVAANMGLVPPAPGFLAGLRAECDRVGARADLRRGHHRVPAGPGRRAGALRRHPRPRLLRQGHRRRSQRRRLRRPGRPDGPDRPARARVPGRHAVGEPPRPPRPGCRAGPPRRRRVRRARGRRAERLAAGLPTAARRRRRRSGCRWPARSSACTWAIRCRATTTRPAPPTTAPTPPVPRPARPGRGAGTGRLRGHVPGPRPRRRGGDEVAAGATEAAAVAGAAQPGGRPIRRWCDRPRPRTAAADREPVVERAILAPDRGPRSRRRSARCSASRVRPTWRHEARPRGRGPRVSRTGEASRRPGPVRDVGDVTAGGAGAPVVSRVGQLAASRAPRPDPRRAHVACGPTAPRAACRDQPRGVRRSGCRTLAGRRSSPARLAARGATSGTTRRHTRRDGPASPWPARPGPPAAVVRRHRSPPGPRGGPRSGRPTVSAACDRCDAPAEGVLLACAACDIDRVMLINAACGREARVAYSSSPVAPPPGLRPARACTRDDLPESRRGGSCM